MWEKWYIVRNSVLNYDNELRWPGSWIRHTGPKMWDKAGFEGQTCTTTFMSNCKILG